MTDLFFELIRVAIGTQEGLSRLPSQKEWKALYDMAKKQSLVGVCFAGLQRLGADADEGFARIGISEMLYLTWMGMTAKIQQKNQTVDEQCVALQKRLSADGLRSCILKGLGVASLYSEHLLGLRQSGDIDMLVDCDFNQAAEFVKEVSGKDVRWAYKDISIPLFEDTEVELHIKPGIMFNPFHNHTWQKWYKSNKDIVFIPTSGDSFSTPSIEFNLIYILHHCYMHLFESGVGLRQFMDYYFVLKTSLLLNKENCLKVIETLGMIRFAKGTMWIMQEVFGLEKDSLLIEPEESEGRFLLNEIMQSGNFGKHDDRFEHNTKNRKDKLKYFFKRSSILVRHYPQEALWMPWYFVWHYIMKQIKR